jgi:hypothetical protein
MEARTLTVRQTRKVTTAAVREFRVSRISEAVRRVCRFSENWVVTPAAEWPRLRPARQYGQSAMTVDGLLQ